MERGRLIGSVLSEASRLLTESGEGAARAYLRERVGMDPAMRPELEKRVQVYQDRLVVPGRDATFQVLPAVPKRLEGLDFTTAILDEFGRIDREVYEVVGLASAEPRDEHEVVVVSELLLAQVAEVAETAVIARPGIGVSLGSG